MLNDKKWLHIIWDFFNYKTSYWLDLDIVKNEISKKIKEVWLRELWNFYHYFWKDAYTWVICLAESHISIHTWPENSFLTLDIYVCNMENNNTQKAYDILDFFKQFYNPTDLNIKYIER